MRTNCCYKEEKKSKLEKCKYFAFYLNGPLMPSQEDIRWCHRNPAMQKNFSSLAHSMEARLQGGWTGCVAAAITNTHKCVLVLRGRSLLEGHKELIFPSTRQTLINLCCDCCLLPSASIFSPVLYL